MLASIIPNTNIAHIFLLSSIRLNVCLRKHANEREMAAKNKKKKKKEI